MRVIPSEFCLGCLLIRWGINDCFLNITLIMRCWSTAVTEMAWLINKDNRNECCIWSWGIPKWTRPDLDICKTKHHCWLAHSRLSARSTTCIPLALSKHIIVYKQVICIIYYICMYLVLCLFVSTYIVIYDTFTYIYTYTFVFLSFVEIYKYISMCMYIYV